MHVLNFFVTFLLLTTNTALYSRIIAFSFIILISLVPNTNYVKPDSGDVGGFIR